MRLLEAAEKLRVATGLDANLAELATSMSNLKERMLRYQQHEMELRALIEASLDLNTFRKFDEVLNALVRRARNLVRAALAYIAIYDHEHDDFFVLAHESAVSHKFPELRMARGTGIMHRVATTKRPFYTSNYLEDARFVHDPVVDQTMSEENLKSLIGVPLLLANKVIGVFFVGDCYARSYLPDEIAILSALATHAALAIENARSFEEAQTALQRASEAHARLEPTTSEVLAAAEAHEQLTALVAEGGSLDALGALLASLLARISQMRTRCGDLKA